MLSQQFLDEIRNRTTLSALVGRTVKLTKAGREFKACCPFHSEKTPSFAVVDERQFYHCHGCGAHGDAIRWLTDHQGLDFIEAVKELAALAGLEMPVRSAAAAAAEARAGTVREALEAAQAIYQRQLTSSGAVAEYLAERGLRHEDIEEFGLGYARGGDGSLKGSGIGQALGKEAGLLTERSAGTGLREFFWDRVTIPIHDARGRLIGFGARTWPGHRGSTVNPPPKFLNSPDGPLFDKGRVLFNLNRARAVMQAERQAMARRAAEDREPINPLLVAEGYFDVVQLHRAGWSAVAPMGTALTAVQFEAAWRLCTCPVLLLDGDAAGRRAARRASELALGLIGAGRMLRVGLLPAGQDPDDMLRRDDGAREIAAVVLEAAPLHRFLFDCARDDWGGDCDPHAIAAVWLKLSELAAQIADVELRTQYLAVWRARFERECSAAPVLAEAEALRAVVRAEADPQTGKPVRYAFPESESDSQARLIALAQVALAKRAERRAITEELADIGKMAEAVGFFKREFNAVLRDIESDLANGPGLREESEMVRVLYRRTLGVRGPMDEAMLPQLVEHRVRAPSAALKRRAAQTALIDAGALSV